MANQNDPYIQQQVAQMSMLLQQQANMGGQNPAMLQHVHDFFQNLNGQIMAQQQQWQQEAPEEQTECEEPCEEFDSDRYERFFSELDKEMYLKIKEIDQLKDSVRREREGFISFMGSLVKKIFSNKFGNGCVGIKMFGSMATELAIETSDVDLVVTGIISQQARSDQDPAFHQKQHSLKMMEILYEKLVEERQSDTVIHSIKFIGSANVPIIKLVADLQVICA